MKNVVFSKGNFYWDEGDGTYTLIESKTSEGYWHTLCGLRQIKHQLTEELQWELSTELDDLLNDTLDSVNVLIGRIERVRVLGTGSRMGEVAWMKD